MVVMHADALFPGFPELQSRAYLAVDFFFVLSGYVMARTYEPRFASGMSALVFMIARFKRLWPVMAVGALLFVPFLMRTGHGGIGMSGPMLWATLALNLALLPNPLTRQAFPLNVPAWSVHCELIANAAHALVLRHLGTRALAGLAAGGLLGLLWTAVWMGHIDVGAHFNEWDGALVRVGFAYVLGVLVWRVHGERQPGAAWAWPALIALPLLFAMPDFTRPYSWIYDVAVIGIACPLVLIGGLALRRGARLAWWSGLVSFPLYATHWPVLYWGRDWGLSGWASIMLTVAVASVVALAFERYYHRAKVAGRRAGG